MNFLKTENFKSRITTAIILAIICIASLFTPQIIMFRVIFAFAGIMAILEIYLASRLRIAGGEITDDRIITFEIAIIVFGFGGIAFFLHSSEIMLVVISAISNDIMAYFTGNLFHDKIFKTRPFPKTSPKKSWEGIIGGYVGSILISFIFLVIYKYTHGLKDLTAMPFGYLELAFIFFAPLFAILGDYVESFVKRYLKVKDSGEIIEQGKIPVLSKCELFVKGHGGYADRIDSCVLVACYMLCLKYLSPP